MGSVGRKSTAGGMAPIPSAQLFGWLRTDEGRTLRSPGDGGRMHLPDSRFWGILGFGLACVGFSEPIARSLRSKKPGGVEQSQDDVKRLARSVRLVGIVLLVIFAVLMLFGA